MEAPHSNFRRRPERECNGRDEDASVLAAVRDVDAALHRRNGTHVRRQTNDRGGLHQVRVHCIVDHLQID